MRGCNSMSLSRFTSLLLLLLIPALPAFTQTAPDDIVGYIRENYTKTEVMVPMRDGVKLFTAIYTPKGASQKVPILLTRTPFSVSPYGADKFPKSLGPDKYFAREGYIFVYQDVRGKWMS